MEERRGREEGKRGGEERRGREEDLRALCSSSYRLWVILVSLATLASSATLVVYHPTPTNITMTKYNWKVKLFGEWNFRRGREPYGAETARAPGAEALDAALIDDRSGGTA